MKNMLDKLNSFKEQGLIKPAAQLKKHNSLDGIEGQNTYGVFFYREKEYPIEHIYGGHDLRLPIAVNDGLKSILKEKISSFDNILFLDTETTGLASGTGTYPFMIGLGWYKDDAFIIRQYFMRHPAEEVALIYDLAKFMEGFDILVSFNGKAFDLPLIQTRFILSGINRMAFNGNHLDLLHGARRIWKESLPSCALTSLEKHHLGLERVNDIPGEFIPAVYFDFLRDGKTNDIERVFTHNLKDILTMVTLIKLMGSRVESPENCTVEERFSIGRIKEKEGDLSGAIRFYCNIDMDNDNPSCRRTLKNLSQVYKKMGQWEKAVEIWEGLLNIPGSFSLFPHIELAKYYEHKEKNYFKALEYVDLAMDSPGFRLLKIEEKQEIIHRKSRLKRNKGTVLSIAPEE